MSRRNGSSSLLFTQAEFAYILLFIALGAFSLLFLQYRAVSEELGFLYEQLEELEEKSNARYACWLRPDAIIPEFVGELVILDANTVSLIRTNGGTRELSFSGGIDTDRLQAEVIALFRNDIDFANKNLCYLRIQVVNQSGSYDLFLSIDKMLRNSGIASIPG